MGSISILKGEKYTPVLCPNILLAFIMKFSFYAIQRYTVYKKKTYQSNIQECSPICLSQVTCKDLRVFKEALHYGTRTGHF